MRSPSFDLTVVSETPANSARAELIIVGNAGGTNVGYSFWRAAQKTSMGARFCDARAASAGPRILRSLSWRLLGHRPPNLIRFSAQVVDICRTERPQVLLTTGLAPLVAGHLAQIGDMGIHRVNYLTDDPWNPAFSSRWFFEALPHYDRVFSVRHANLDDLRAQGCKCVEYLPFAFDDGLFGPDASENDSFDSNQPADFDTVFAGGADRDRVPYAKALLEAGLRVALIGEFWDRFRDTKGRSLGQLAPGDLRRVTRLSKTAICLVRRANRDGHVMRSFEIPAIGTCMLAEDTAEHRDLFGDEGAAVLYFGTILEMTEKLKWLLVNDAERLKMARTAHSLVVHGGHTYTDRLRTILERGNPPAPIPFRLAAQGSVEPEQVSHTTYSLENTPLNM
jgi:spore maturation protein CgeB